MANGGTALDPAVVARLFTRSDASSRLTALTEREREVLALMAEGLSNSAIANRLFLSESAISKYTTTAFDRLGVTDDTNTNRRVLAVLAYINDTPPSSS